MNYQTFNKDLFSFIQSSPTPFHCVDSIKSTLHHSGFIELYENKPWKLTPNTSYYTIRNSGSIVAFHLNKDYSQESNHSFKMFGAHSDSPSLQIKPKQNSTKENNSTVGVEIYGGPIFSTWLDRDLGIAGQIHWLDQAGKINSTLINPNSLLVYIPNVAIHLDREQNKKNSINPQLHLNPIFSQNIPAGQGFNDWLAKLIKKETSQQPAKILSHDLFCYDPQSPQNIGIDNEFISGPRLDNLVSCFIGMRAITDASTTNNNCIFVCNNHEEIGSVTSSGANSSFLNEILMRILPDNETRFISKASSFFVSMDNAHATHPNHIEKSEENHEVHLNGGPVIKINSNKRYASDGISQAVFKKYCTKSSVPYQEFVIRNDMSCGSTIGPVTSALLGISTVDVGIPSLGMHSIREFTGAKDPYLLYKVLHNVVTEG